MDRAVLTNDGEYPATMVMMTTTMPTRAYGNTTQAKQACSLARPKNGRRTHLQVIVLDGVHGRNSLAFKLLHHLPYLLV